MIQSFVRMIVFYVSAGVVDQERGCVAESWRPKLNAVPRSRLLDDDSIEACSNSEM